MADRVSDTCITSPERLLSSTAKDACLVHIYPTGPSMGFRYRLGDKPLMLGRAEDCDLRLQDHSISRRHARIEPTAEGYYVHDQQSTNGTFVNDNQIGSAWLLHDGDYLRIGNCIYRYLAGGNIEAEYHEEIYRLTILDGLTHLHNRRYLTEFLEREVARSQRHYRPLSLLMIDIDKFKAVNDSFGHLCGDFVLQEFAKLVRGTARKEDLFARYGGEEFAAVLVETHHEEAVRAAERIREMVESHRFTFESTPLSVTVSLGVATTTGDPEMTPADLLKAADRHVYLAKERGRNRVVGATDKARA